MLSCFFFQAEDGIRDLVRSRGLGDVYKRQFLNILGLLVAGFAVISYVSYIKTGTVLILINDMPVSYTHLTLPTSDLV